MRSSPPALRHGHGDRHPLPERHPHLRRCRLQAATISIPDSVRKNITDRTRAIIVVHLWGQAANMDEFLKIGKERSIPIIEDCAQAYLTT